MKKWLNRLFIDGLSGMATGLFSTLIVGTIIQQIGTLIGGTVGNYLFFFGKMAAAMTGAGVSAVVLPVNSEKAPWWCSPLQRPVW